MANLANQIDAYLKQQGSPLAGKGGMIVKAGKKYGVDPRLIVAISGAETSFGKYGPAQKIHNAWGWGPHIKFGSWDEGIQTIAKGLASGYKSLGTIAKISGKWAPVGAANDPTNLNKNWTKTVSTFYQQLGGNPNANVFGATDPSVDFGAPPVPTAVHTTTVGKTPTTVLRAPITVPMGVIDQGIQHDFQALQAGKMPDASSLMRILQIFQGRTPVQVPRPQGSELGPGPIPTAAPPLGDTTYGGVQVKNNVGQMYTLPALDQSKFKVPGKVSYIRTPAGDRMPITQFDGKPVGAWMASVLSFARKHGWKGQLSSGYRTQAEQEALWAAHPDPKWVARPGHSPHQFAQGVDITDGPQFQKIIAKYKLPVTRYEPEGWHFEPMGFRADGVRFWK